jgi:hypothetical protein
MHKDSEPSSTQNKLRVPLLVVSVLLLPMVLVWGQATVSGRISTIDYGLLARIGNPIIEFQNADGLTTTALGSAIGEYTVSLPPGEYTLTVSAKGFCPAHRPPYRLDAGSNINFDFTLTTLCPRDRMAVGDLGAYYDSAIPYYFEQTVMLNKDSQLIIVFGRRRRTREGLEFSALPIRTHPGVQIPVTIRFGTYTVQSETALLSQKTKVLTAKGNVTVEDGNKSEGHTSSCVMLRLDDTNHKFQHCDEASRQSEQTDQR